MYSINTNWRKKKTVIIRENIFCLCKGLYGSEMVRCTKCSEWFHFPCLEKCTADVYSNVLSAVFFPQVRVYTDMIISDSKIMISVQEIEINLHCTLAVLAVENVNIFQKELPK